MKKIAVCVPSMDFVHAEFAMSLACLARHRCMLYEIELVHARTSMIVEGRERLAKMAMDMEADSILWLDSDMTFPPDLLERLCRHKHDIVGIDYSRKVEPFDRIAEGLDGKRLTKRTGVEQARIIGFGGLLVKTAVFRKIKRPWFNIRWVIDGMQSEDFFFCEQARNNGFKIYVDNDLSSECGHIGHRIVDLK